MKYLNDRNRNTDTNEIDSRRKPLWYSGRYFDYPLLGIVLGLVLFGLVMVYSTSSYRADELYGDSTYFAKRQLVFELVALFGMFLVSKIDYRRYARYSKYFLYVAMALLVLVYIIGSASHGSTRWIYIGAFGFQPSEFAKLALIVYTADICTRKPRSLNTLKGLAKMLLLPFVTIILIAIENLSTAIICFGIVVIIVFVASPKKWPFVLMGLIGILNLLQQQAIVQIVSVSGLHRKNTMMDTRRCSPFMRSDPEAFLEEALGTVSRRWDLYQSPIMT